LRDTKTTTIAIGYDEEGQVLFIGKLRHGFTKAIKQEIYQTTAQTTGDGRVPVRRDPPAPNTRRTGRGRAGERGRDPRDGDLDFLGALGRRDAEPSPGRPGWAVNTWAKTAWVSTRRSRSPRMQTATRATAAAVRSRLSACLGVRGCPPALESAAFACLPTPPSLGPALYPLWV